MGGNAAAASGTAAAGVGVVVITASGGPCEGTRGCCSRRCGCDARACGGSERDEAEGAALDGPRTDSEAAAAALCLLPREAASFGAGAEAGTEAADVPERMSWAFWGGGDVGERRMTTAMIRVDGQMALVFVLGITA